MRLNIVIKAQAYASHTLTSGAGRGGEAERFMQMPPSSTKTNETNGFRVGGK